MLHKQTILIIIIIFGLTILQAQIINVKQKNGSLDTFDFKSIQKLSFADGYMNIKNMDNTINLFIINEIGCLSFSPQSTSTDNSLQILDNSRFSVFPNPASEIIRITGLKNVKGLIRILSIRGEILQSKKTNMSMININISSLPNGVYLCQYKNITETIVVKFTKK